MCYKPAANSAQVVARGACSGASRASPETVMNPTASLRLRARAHAGDARARRERSAAAAGLPARRRLARHPVPLEARRAGRPLLMRAVPALRPSDRGLGANRGVSGGVGAPPCAHSTLNTAEIRQPTSSGEAITIARSRCEIPSFPYRRRNVFLSEATFPSPGERGVHDQFW